MSTVLYAPTLAPTSRDSIAVRADLRSSTTDGAFFSLMVGLGETYLAAFALAIGSGELVAGLVATVPMLAGAILQLASPWAVARIRSHRLWVVSAAITQATSLLVLPLLLWSEHFRTPLLFGVATLYWAAGLASGPAWNAWMETLVPPSCRAHFFAQRARICQTCVLAGFVAAGILLQSSTSRQSTLTTFMCLFVLAAGCRYVSAAFLARQRELRWESAALERPNLFRALRHLKGHAGGRLLAYLFVVQWTVQMAGPFFTPYLLSELRFSYLEFMFLIGAGFAGKMWGMPLWGRYAHHWGAQRLLRIGGLGIIPFSALWMFSSNFWYLFTLQVLAGLAWGAYELAIVLLFFETIPRHERTGLLTIYNVSNAVALSCGALVGGSLLHCLELGHGSHLAGWSPYALLFGCSTVMRLVSIPLLFRVPDLRFAVTTPTLRLLSVRPAEAGADPPVLPSIPPETHAKAG